jgi:acetylornithine deacetylase
MSTEISSFQRALGLLENLIATPSFSREEAATALIIENHLKNAGISPYRLMNNVYAFNKHFNPALPTILLNSHHDTVKPVKGYTTDPFTPTLADGKLIGLGSNDAGGPLVALIETFIHFYPQTDLPVNFILAATAEEEISGKNGIELLLQDSVFLSKLHGSVIMGALVGEPTKMEMAVAERGLLVIDGIATGKAGHAAREEGDNAISIALQDIMNIHETYFDKVSTLIGKTTAKVTVIETDNKAHNVIPGQCRFVVDVRVNELYSFEEVMGILKSKVRSELMNRSFRLKSTMISLEHPLVMAGHTMALPHYGSPTTSDKALMPFPALKIGPGDSARSHTANEFIYLRELEDGINKYIQLLNITLSSLKS